MRSCEILQFPNSKRPPTAFLFLGLGIALRGSRSGIRNGFRSAGIKGEEVFAGAVELHAAAGGFGDFLSEADVVEAGFDIEDADALRV